MRELTAANILTLSRLLLLPPLIALFYVPAPWAAWACLALYLAAAATPARSGGRA